MKLKKVALGVVCATMMMMGGFSSTLAFKNDNGDTVVNLGDLKEMEKLIVGAFKSKPVKSLILGTLGSAGVIATGLCLSGLNETISKNKFKGLSDRINDVINFAGLLTVAGFGGHFVWSCIKELKS